MPPIPTAPSLRRRELSQVQNFAIVFAVVAFLAVAICLVMIIAFKCRRRQQPSTSVPLSRYPVAPNYPHPFAPPPQFPSRPTVLRGLRREDTQASVRHYNPRVESPFPHAPNSPSLSTRHENARLNRNNNPAHPSTYFTPEPRIPKHSKAKNSGAISKRIFTPTEPREELTYSRPVDIFLNNNASNPRLFTNFGAKHDDILPVPIPALKPRAAGKPPGLARQLDKFPMPFSTPKGGHLHPAKLFEKVEQRSSDDTADIFGTPCPVPQSIVDSSPLDMEKIREPIPIPRSYSLSNITPFVPKPLAVFDNGIITKAPDKTPPVTQGWLKMRPIERAYANAAGLERMGTLTRPHTPVKERRDWFDRTTGKEKPTSQPTPSTYIEPFTTPGGLDSTAPTSPATYLKMTAPSTPPEEDEKHGAKLGAAHCHRRTPSSIGVLPLPDKLIGVPFGAAEKHAAQCDNGSPVRKISKKRLNRKRLKLPSWSQLRPTTRRWSVNTLSTIYKPMLTGRSQNSQGDSSMYSSDAQNLSYWKPEASRIRSELALSTRVRRTSSHRKHASFQHGTSGRPDDTQSLSNDMPLDTKIDDWMQHTGDFEASPLVASVFSSAAMKRSISDSELGSTAAESSSAPKMATESPPPCPTIHLGRSSDDVFGIEADGFPSHEAGVLMKKISQHEIGEWI